MEKIACLVLQELTKVRANPLRERLGGVSVLCKDSLKNIISLF